MRGATLSHSWNKGGVEGGRAASRRLAGQARSRTACYRPMTGLTGVGALTVMFPATPRRAHVHELGTRGRGTAGNSRARGLKGWSPLSFPCCRGRNSTNGQHAQRAFFCLDVTLFLLALIVPPLHGKLFRIRVRVTISRGGSVVVLAQALCGC